MKARAAWLIGLSLLLAPVASLAESESLSMDDVLRLHSGGVSDDVIISEIVVTGSIFALDVDDILRLNAAGLSDRLVKFMIDTRAGDSGAYTDQTWEDTGEYESWEDPESESGYEYDDAGTIWANELEEEPTETRTYWVSLNYNYGSWWYDCYWNDYWYWDFSYSPYRVSWSASFGAWYPTWYSYWNVYSPGCYGYRYHYGNRYGHHYYAYYDTGCYYDPYWSHSGYGYGHGYGHHGGRNTLSDVKYKAGSTSGDKQLYALGKLDMKDVRKMPATKTGGRLREGRTPRGDVVLADRGRPDRNDPRVLRPVRSKPSPDRVDDTRGRGLGSDIPDRPTGDLRRPPRSGRSPATGGRPVRIRTPTRDVTSPDVRRPDPPSKPVERPGPDVDRPRPKPKPPTVDPPTPPRKPVTGVAKPKPKPPRKPSPGEVKPKPKPPKKPTSGVVNPKPRKNPGSGVAKPKPAKPGSSSVRPAPKPPARPKSGSSSSVRSAPTRSSSASSTRGKSSRGSSSSRSKSKGKRR